MISIIISTYRADHIKFLQSNIARTIGSSVYEIVKVENPGIMSLSEAYNYGAKQAVYDYLLFLHEDVEFLKENWGEILIRYLSIKNIGICGLAGSKKQFKLPIGYETGLRKYRRIFVCKNKTNLLLENRGKTKIKVKSLDGVFLAMPKKIWKEFKFNEDIEGYHFYDLDISLRVSAEYQNYVASEIVLHHFSSGNFGTLWVEKAMKFYRQNYNFDDITEDELGHLRKFWYKRLKKEKITLINKIRYINKLGIGRKSKGAALEFLYSSF